MLYRKKFSVFYEDFMLFSIFKSFCVCTCSVFVFAMHVCKKGE